MFSRKKTDQIIKNLQEKQPLPLGVTEFNSWSHRIIEGAMLYGRAELDSMRFALASMIIELGPTEAFKEDGYFIQRLRKIISNQIAESQMRTIRDNAKARLAAKELEEKGSQPGPVGSASN